MKFHEIETFVFAPRRIQDSPCFAPKKRYRMVNFKIRYAILLLLTNVIFYTDTCKQTSEILQIIAII